MRDLFILGTHLLATVARLMRPGGIRAIAAESLLLKHHLVILNRSRKEPHISRHGIDSFWVSARFFVHPKRVQKLAVALKPSTFLRFHQALTKLKYHLLYASGCRRRPGPKGPSPELIAAIVEMKRRDPRFGCPRIVRSFGVEIDSACSLSTTDPHPGMMARHGSPTSDMRRTVCIAST